MISSRFQIKLFVFVFIEVSFLVQILFFLLEFFFSQSNVKNMFLLLYQALLNFIVHHWFGLVLFFLSLQYKQNNWYCVCSQAQVWTRLCSCSNRNLLPRSCRWQATWGKFTTTLTSKTMRLNRSKMASDDPRSPQSTTKATSWRKTKKRRELTVFEWKQWTN